MSNDRRTSLKQQHADHPYFFHFMTPVAPPPPPSKLQPEQLGLYDTQDWENAYRDLDARVPHLLIQLQDDLTRSRRREAAWISIIVHLLLFIVLIICLGFTEEVGTTQSSSRSAPCRIRT